MRTRRFYSAEEIIEACAWAAHDVGCVFSATVRRRKTTPWQELRRGKKGARRAVCLQLARYPEEDGGGPWFMLFQRVVNAVAGSLGWDRDSAKAMSRALEEEDIHPWLFSGPLSHEPRARGRGRA
jgi:hypothetical protein